MREKFSLLILLMLMVGVYTVGAQSAEDHPLRSIRQETSADSSPLLPGNTVIRSGSFLPAESSLLSASDIEQELTQYYIRQYSSPGGITWLTAILKRADIYIPYIRQEIERRNLPPELLYLPVIESGYQSSAKSKSGAVGLWQFMLNSIGPFDMKVNDMVDERKDFQKSTKGALQKLEENYRFFGSWPLALAAYNAGLGALNRTIQKTGIRDYWLLCEKKELRSETIHYVPKLLAAAWVLSQPRRFGLDHWPENVEWETLPVGRQISIEILAAETGIDPELLRKGNMELNYGLTPADSAYRLKVPAQTAALVAETLEREDLKLLTHYRYVIKYGDTLSALARHYNTPLMLIEQLNPGISNRYLKIGETIVIPALKEIEPYTGKTGQSDNSPDMPAFTGTHLVKKGETLWSIAIAYSVDPGLLAQANSMEMNQILPEGKTLKVPIME